MIFLSVYYDSFQFCVVHRSSGFVDGHHLQFFRHVALSDPTWFVKSVKPIDWIPMFCDALLVFHSPCCVVDVASTDCDCKLLRIGALDSLKALIDHHLPDQVSQVLLQKILSLMLFSLVAFCNSNGFVQFCAQQFVPKLLSRLQRATCVPITGIYMF